MRCRWPGGAMRRRNFIKLLGAAAAWPLAARAQHGERVRRIAVLNHSSSNEPEAQARMAAFLQGLQDAGWEVGRNLSIEYRWSVGDRGRLFKDARELVALNPEVIFAGVGATTPALQQATNVVPIVFAQGIDPTIETLSRDEVEIVKTRVRPKISPDAEGRITHSAFANAIKGRVRK